MCLVPRPTKNWDSFTGDQHVKTPFKNAFHVVIRLEINTHAHTLHFTRPPTSRAKTIERATRRQVEEELPPTRLHML